LTERSPAATRAPAARPPGREIVADRPKVPRDLAHALLAGIVENSDDAIASKTLDGVVTSWNRAAERLFGYPAGEIVGRHISVLAAPGREGEMPAILERIRRGERVDHYDTVRRRKDGTLVEVSLTVSPVRDARGRIVGASKIARDIGERRRAERERELRLGELRHRVKNLLAVVRALARRTGTEGRSGEQYRDDLLGRLEALTVAHELAFGRDSVDLAALVGRTLEPYAGDRAAVAVATGPAVTLAEAKVQALALVLHELATNAVKHGALSAPGGRVRVGWEVVEAGGVRRLRLRWEERGGPRVVGPPAARGFGTALVGFVATRELGGPAELTFAPEGLQAEITVLLG
jgi:PAS domain S-box-containing protein